jgi:cell wall-associated NlpC family hydrolase
MSRLCSLPLRMMARGIGRLAFVARWVRSWPLLVALAVVMGTSSLVMTFSTASASTVSQDRATIKQIKAEIAHDWAITSALSNRFDEEQGQLQAEQAKLSALKKRLASDQASANQALARLRRDAINAFVENGSATSSIGAVLDSSLGNLGLKTEYLDVAQGRLQNALNAFKLAEHATKKAEAGVRSQEAATKATMAQIAQDRAKAQAAVAQEDAILAKVKGNLQQLLEQIHAQEVAAAAAAARRAAEARQAALIAQEQAQAQLSSGGGGGASTYSPPPPPPPSASWQQRAQIAVHAALSQVGVPYVWGGASPSEGFDCSGLVMWAWEQAGVYLPHYSVAQYDDVTQVPASDLQPGDIVFYYSPYESAQPGHEALYIGNGQVVQAPETGMDVMVTSLTWAGDPIGYGQPG